MLKLPEFVEHSGYPHRVLPDGVWWCDENPLDAEFVETLPESTTRRQIASGFQALCQEALALKLNAVQWLDGSFVETKLNPQDLDVVTFFDHDQLNQFGAAERSFVLNWLNGGTITRERYQTHAFLVLSCEPGHSYCETFDAARDYWRTWFGRTRRIPQGPDGTTIRFPKGFLAMILGDSSQVRQISDERSST